MNKDIESRLKELRLAAPSPELKTTVLSNARAAWSDKNESPILHMQFRQAQESVRSTNMVQRLFATYLQFSRKHQKSK